MILKLSPSGVPKPSIRQRGAALLAAMLTVTLVATIASTALWQQWRLVEVETAERNRVQSAWILIGALDWSRLILREDGRSGGADHLAEPWAVPLQEARLSTFLAADKNVSQVQDASTDTTDAFLSGYMVDMQSRLNITNLIAGAGTDPLALRQFERLFERLGIPITELSALTQGLQATQKPTAAGNNAPLMPRSSAQLGWLGLTSATVAQLQPFVTILPVRTPININTASAEVLWASFEGIDEATVQKILQTRANQHFRILADVRNLVGNELSLSDNAHAVASAYFEVNGSLRLENVQVHERSLVNRQDNNKLVTLWRERGNVKAGQI
jgi:general secretion pathway protein K